MYKVTLTKIKSSHNNLPKEYYEGYCMTLPTVGEQFMLLGPPTSMSELLGIDTSQMDEEDVSELNSTAMHTLQVITTEVKLMDPESMTFSTQNSVYKLSIQEAPELPRRGAWPHDGAFARGGVRGTDRAPDGSCGA